LRLTGSNAFAPLYVVPATAAFLNIHPKVSVDLELSDRYVDLIDEGFDLAIRIAETPDSTLKARRLTNLRRVVFASPTYIAKHGRPSRPISPTTGASFARRHAKGRFACSASDPGSGPSGSQVVAGPAARLPRTRRRSRDWELPARRCGKCDRSSIRAS
jgi:DNA-binding transcriptional LysR family regulator